MALEQMDTESQFVLGIVVTCVLLGCFVCYVRVPYWCTNV